ncbi:MAG: hypothetical protein KKA75_07130 [Proteobacteria bacterium]|nr:hypothetical protein [Pseudomonadota bacterium]
MVTIEKRVGKIVSGAIESATEVEGGAFFQRECVAATKIRYRCGHGGFE